MARVVGGRDAATDERVIDALAPFGSTTAGAARRCGRTGRLRRRASRLSGHDTSHGAGRNASGLVQPSCESTVRASRRRSRAPGRPSAQAACERTRGSSFESAAASARACPSCLTSCLSSRRTPTRRDRRCATGNHRRGSSARGCRLRQLVTRGGGRRSSIPIGSLPVEPFRDPARHGSAHSKTAKKLAGALPAALRAVRHCRGWSMSAGSACRRGRRKREPRARRVASRAWNRGCICDQLSRPWRVRAADPGPSRTPCLPTSPTPSPPPAPARPHVAAVEAAHRELSLSSDGSPPPSRAREHAPRLAHGRDGPTAGVPEAPDGARRGQGRRARFVSRAGMREAAAAAARPGSTAPAPPCRGSPTRAATRCSRPGRSSASPRC
jgi:hypothetical protein